MSSLPSLTLIGPGRAGRALARSWVRGGGALVAVIGRTLPSAQRGVEALQCGRAAVLEGGAFETEVVVLAVPDDLIGEVASAAAGALTSRLAYHLSGALPADVLSPLSRTGASLGSFHPLRAFTGGPDDTLRGAFLAIEGEEEACRAALGFSEILGAEAHRLSPDAKPLYHAGATLAAGGVVSLIGLAARAWSLAGIPEEVSRPALAGLAGRSAAGAELRQFTEALTGPIARRDLSTVRSHCAALANHPDLLAMYRTLACETIARTPGAGREEELRALLAC
ncbi:MAG: Rossmann-like and DUF2520 domain-containing protein [Acidobacteriota bacterium]